MKLWCLKDSGGWGNVLCQEAIKRGFTSSNLFSSESIPYKDGWLRTGERNAPPLFTIQPGDYVFLRLSQLAANLSIEKTMLPFLLKKEVKLIPDLKTCECYEDKVRQVQFYHDWMPTTFLAFSEKEARCYLDMLPYPFLSKSRTGSASRNVRIIADRAAAEQEIEQVFSTGLEAPHKLGELRQTGYLIWQELLQGNDYDYRVVITGRHLMCLKRYNRPGTIFASGSGVNEPADTGSLEVQQVLEKAKQFFDAHDIRWGGIDLVKDHGPSVNTWLVLETTLGWSQVAYENCQFALPFEYQGNFSFEKTKYFGKDIWTVLLNEIESGVFA